MQTKSLVNGNLFKSALKMSGGLSKQYHSPSSSTEPLGPVERAIHEKLNKELEPKSLKIHNDSNLHRGHSAMKGVESMETHFRVQIVSDKFEGLNRVQRHRLVYNLLGDQFQAGLHALQLVTQTPSETK